MGDTVEGGQRNEPGLWTFWRKKDGSWHWRQAGLDGVLRTSAAGYRALWDCMANAMYHGYVPASDTDDEGATAAA